jgi:lipoate synthase
MTIETVPAQYRAARAGASYEGSLDLLARVKHARPAMLTKSGLMVGLGETDAELLATMRDIRAQQVDVLTIELQAYRCPRKVAHSANTSTLGAICLALQ